MHNLKEFLHLLCIHFPVRIFLQQELNNRRDSNFFSQFHLQENPSVQVIHNAEVTEFLGEKKLEKIKIRQEKKEQEICADGAFVAIGSDPNSNLVKGQLKRDRWGRILTDKATGATSIPGVFAAGDIQQSGTRQAILAAASGCLAALSCKEYLLEK